jgi:hypothetical protein
MSVRLVIGTARADDTTTWVYRDSGSSVSLLWSADHGNRVNGVAIDAALNVYAGGIASSGVVARKYDWAGAEITSDNWPISNHSDTLLRVRVDGAGRVYTAGGNTYRRYSSAGAQLNGISHGNNVRDIAIDSTGLVVFTGFRSSAVTTRQYWHGEFSTVKQWDRDHGAATECAAVDLSDDAIYIGGDRTASVTTRKYSSAGVQITTGWPKDHGATVRTIAVDEDGNVYTGGTRSSNITTRKYSSAGAEVTTGNWPIDHGGTVYDVAIIDGHLYTVGFPVSGIAVRKYTLDGTPVWTLELPATPYGIAGIRELDTAAPPLALPIRVGLPFATLAANPTSTPPALALPFALRVPLLITDREDIAPGLALNLALRLPTIRLEHPHAFQFQEVYALYLGGVLLPFSSITARRNAGGLSLSVTIPSASAALLAAVAANEGGTLRVLRGPRLPDGSLQLDGLWAAPLESWSYRAGAENGSITLQASAPTAIQAARPRALREVSYVGNDRGARRVRCRIDSYLQPGDVALLGAGQTLIVDDLTYSIQPGAAFMEARGV